MTKRFLVCRLDALRPDNRMKSSDYWPMEVVMDYEPGTVIETEEIVKKAFERVSPNYIGFHSYIVVPLGNAVVIDFHKHQPPPPPPKYTTICTNYEALRPRSSY